jgi:hypothetical protein
MSFLREIQAALCDNKELGSILLKLRLLASRLGSDVLEDWVKQESDGYPRDAEIPDYRKIGVDYKATFSGPFGARITDAPIPSHLIAKIAGDRWLTFEMRDGMGAIDDLLANGESDVLHLTYTSNLILLLQGNVYEGYACNSVSGIIPKAALAGIQHTVRSRILELTIELEKRIPAAAEITIHSPKPEIERIGETVTQITNHVIHGNVTTISNSGDGAQFFINISSGDTNSIEKGLIDNGIPATDAEEFTALLASEHPESKEEPFGPKAKAWIAKSLVKVADGTWKTGMAVATKILTEAALTYYGLK